MLKVEAAMPRRPIGRRGKVWGIKTDPDLILPTLASKHQESSEAIRRAYGSLDSVTYKIAPVLDRYGILANVRTLYRSYAEELWRLKKTYSGKTLESSANVIATKYKNYGCDGDALKDVARILGLSVEFMGLPAGVTNHNLLSTLHPDTLPANVVAGDLIIGNITPKWSRLPIGDELYILKVISGLPCWGQVFWDEIPDKPTTFPPEGHKANHENTGSDEISVQGLSGLLADAQTPLVHNQARSTITDFFDAPFWGSIPDKPSSFPPSTHASTHENTGSDEISVSGLSGLLADAQTPLAHKTTHQDTGTDEISVSGLSGLLADKQTPLGHQLDNSTYHTVSGLTTGHVLTALGASSFGFASPIWILAETLSPSGVNTISSSVFSAHSCWMLIFDLVISGGAETLGLRLNGDAGANYTARYISALAILNTGALTWLRIAESTIASGSVLGCLVVKGKSTGEPIVISGHSAPSVSSGTSFVNGYYSVAANINRFTFLSAITGRNFSGKIKIYYMDY